MRPANFRPSFGCVGRILVGLQASLLVLALSAPPGVAQSIVVRVGDETTTSVAPGAEIEIPIVVDMAQAGGLDIASLTFDLTWDPSLLTYVEAVPGTFGSVVFNDENVASGQLATSLFNATGTTNTFTAISVVLSADAEAEDQGTLVVVDVTAAGDGNGSDILGSVSEADLCLCIGLAGLLGDVSDDETVNIIDAQQIARYSVGLPPPPDPTIVADRGDVNEDGLPNIIDAQQIARWTVGLPVPESPNIGQAMSAGCTCGDGITGTWEGAIDVEGIAIPLTLWLTDADGSVTGTGMIMTDAMSVSGSRTGYDVTLTMTVEGYNPFVFTGVWDGADDMTGVTNESGFVDAPTQLTRIDGDGPMLYSGTTSQGEAITFIVSDDGSSIEPGLQIAFYLECQTCTGTWTVTVNNTIPITDGAFSYTSASIDFSVSGSAESATTFSGSAAYTPSDPPAECGTCPRAEVTWTASQVDAAPVQAAVGVGDLVPVLLRETERMSCEGHCVDIVIEKPKGQ
jgi:hypothetical protein